MTTTQGGTYLRKLRDRQGLKQEELGALIGASRSTVLRMESGSEETRHMTVMHALAVLHASAEFYCELAVDSGLTVEHTLRRHAVLDGLSTYARVMAQHRGLKSDTAEWAGRALTTSLGLSTAFVAGGASAGFPLLVLLILLEAPHADLTAIIAAADDHVVLGERLAAERIAFDAPHVANGAIPMQHVAQVPLLASVLRRLAKITRNADDRPLLQAEVELAITEIHSFLSHFLALITPRETS